MPGPRGTFIDGFIFLINELPIQHRILIVGDFSIDQILPVNVPKVDPLCKVLTCLSLHDIQLIYMEDYWILFLILQIPMLFLLYHHPTMITMFFFSKSDHYIYIECSFQSSLHNL